MKILRGLIERQEKLGDWRSRLADTPALVRVQVIWEMYLDVRTALFDQIQMLFETKGIQAGLKLSGPLLRARQDGLRSAIGEARMDAEDGKLRMTELSAVAASVQQSLEERREEMMRHAGTVDGYVKTATSALEKIEQTLANHDRQIRAAEEDADNWSGRATENGQRPVKVKGNGVKKTTRKKALAPAAE